MQAILSWDPVHNRVAPNASSDVYATADPLNASYAFSPDGATGVVSLSGPAMVPGDAVILRHAVYSYDVFAASGVAGLAFANVTVLAGGGMGVVTSACSDVDLDGFRVMRGPGRPMSITADGCHFTNSAGGRVRVTRSLFEGQGDDGMNIPTIFQQVVTLAPDRMSLQVQGRGDVGPSRSPVGRAGAGVNFFDRATLALLGSVPATAVDADGTIHLAAPAPPGTALYSLITGAWAYPESVEVTDSVFRGNRARGVLLKAGNALLARNRFEHCSGAAVKTETDGCFWFEGAPVHNWTVVNNTIVGVNYGPGRMAGDVVVDNSVPVFSHGAPTTACVPYDGGGAVHTGLTIAGNTFAEQSVGQAAVAVFAAGGLVVAGNTVEPPADGAPRPALNFAGYGCSDVTFEGNVCAGGAACTATGL